MIIGIGVDIVEIERFQGVLKKNGPRFLKKVFTEREVAYCTGRRNAEQHFAARFAAKEATFKALRVSSRSAVGWKELEVVARRGYGPRMVLHGYAEEVAEKKGIKRIHLSLTHTAGGAAAWVIAEG